MNKAPIGFFDSGLGGLSVWMEVNVKLPNEETIYLADSINAPYGVKSKDQIIHLAEKNTEFLLEHDCKIVVVACNTATTSAIKHLRDTYDVPFIGIEPAVKSAALQTKKNKIGILATEGTLVSSLFLETSEKYTKDITTINQHGTGLVKLIEDGDLGSEELKLLVQHLLKDMVSEGIDYLVLGCTHYPFLIPILKEILPKSVKILDSGEAVARRTKFVLNELEMLSETSGELTNSQHVFYTNKSKEIMQEFMNQINIPYSCQYMEF